MSDNDETIETLRQLPEVRLSLINLAWEVCIDGKVDDKKATLHAEELVLAEKEAQAYINDTKEAVCELKRLGRSKF